MMGRNGKKAREKILGGILTLALVTGILTECVPWMSVVCASESEPVYNSTTDELKYEQQNISLGKNKAQGFDVTIPEGDTYYMSYTVKSAAGFYFDYRGSGRLYLGKTQYCVLGVNGKQDWVQGATGVEEGVRVTLKVTEDKVTIWLNGKKAIEDAVLDTRGAGVPKVTWTEDEAEFTDIQIWTAKSEDPPLPPDAPIYNPAVDTLYPIKTVSGGVHNEDTVAVAPESASVFVTDLPYHADYCISMKVKVEGNGSKSVNIRYRGKNALFVMNQSGYQLTAGENTGWVNRALDMQQGVDITIRSSKDRLQVWLGGYKIYDVAHTAGGNAQPGIQWSYDNNVTVSGIKIWSQTVLDTDEPVYDEKTDYRYDIDHATDGTYANGILTILQEKQSVLLSELPHNASYYMTMKVKTAGAVNLLYRDGVSGKQGIFTMQTNGYQCTDVAWVNKEIYSLASGARVTWYSTSDHIQIWVDGEKLVDAAYDKGGTAQPGIAWSFNNEVTVTDMCLWTREADYSDEPVYQPDIHVLHPVEDYGNGSWNGQELTVEPLTNSYFDAGLSAKADYYMSFLVAGNQAVNVMYRNPNGVFQINSTGYLSMGTDDEWVDRPIRKFPYGVRVTIHSAPNHVTVWVDGEKLIDENYEKAGESSPGISWSFDTGVRVRDIKIWTDKEGARPYLGEVLNTPEARLSQKKSYGVAVHPQKKVEKHTDQQPIGKSIQNTQREMQDSAYEVFPATVSGEETSDNGIVTVTLLATIAAVVAATAVILIAWIRKRAAKG